MQFQRPFRMIRLLLIISYNLEVLGSECLLVGRVYCSFVFTYQKIFTNTLCGFFCMSSTKMFWMRLVWSFYTQDYLTMLSLKSSSTFRLKYQFKSFTRFGCTLYLAAQPKAFSLGKHFIESLGMWPWHWPYKFYHFWTPIPAVRHAPHNKQYHTWDPTYW